MTDHEPDPWTDPEAGDRRFGVFLLLGVLLAVATAVGWLGGEEILPLGVFLFGLFFYVEYQIHDKARRDYATDLSQLIHDEKVEGDDLRRTRGLKNVEDRLEPGRRRR